MCKLTIDVDEERIAKYHPWINRDVLSLYFQRRADEIVERLIEDPFYDSPISHTEEEMKVIVKERIRQMESGEVTMIPGEQVFAEMCERYGFKI